MTPSLPSEAETVVVGGGIVGMCLARLLARDGREVVLIDASRDAGSTANAGSLHVQMQSRFMRLYPEAVPALERSLPLYPRAVRTWRELSTELGVDIELKVSGGLMVAEDETQFTFLSQKCARERAIGLDTHMLDRTELRRVAPYLGDSVYGAELCADEGKLNPLLANHAIRRSALEAGVIHAAETRVAALARDGNAYRVDTGRHVIRCGTVVLAAGAGTGALAEQLGANVPTVAEPLHMNITEATEPLILHLVQHADRMITLKQLGAGQVVIGGGWPARLSGSAQFPTVEAASLVGNLSLAQHVVPRVGSLKLLRTWAGINTTTDGSCVLGPLPGHTNAFVAVPGDAGYTLGPLVAEMAAAMLAGRDPGFDVAPFSPARFSRAAPN